MTYFHFEDAPAFKPDHVVVEVYDGGRWKLVDAEQHDPVRDGEAVFSASDIPRDRFLVGGDVWRKCRSGQADANDYGVVPADTFWRGLWAVRSRMVDDLAMLNKVEYLLWDGWGLKDYDPPSEDDLHLLDDVAALTGAAHNDGNFDALRGFYAHDRLRAPRSFLSFSPVAGERRIVLD